MVNRTKRSKDEQRFWDSIAERLAEKCFEQSPEGCAHQVRDIADALLAERRKSQQESAQ